MKYKIGSIIYYNPEKTYRRGFDLVIKVENHTHGFSITTLRYKPRFIYSFVEKLTSETDCAVDVICE